MKLLPCLGPMAVESGSRRSCWCNFVALSPLCCLAFLVGASFFVGRQNLPSSWVVVGSLVDRKGLECKNRCYSPGSETLPKGIINGKSDLELIPIQSSEISESVVNNKVAGGTPKNLLAISVGLKQKDIVDKIASKFFDHNFTIILFHYDGVVDNWRGLRWSNNAIHVSAINQTKWWFAKRFLHPDIVDGYDYIFLWDEDLGVEHFNPARYVSIIQEEGLHISQPALDTAKSEVHHQITARSRKGRLHRRIYKSRGHNRCYDNSTAPPCTGWVEMMAPVFTRAAWRCVWHMIQNDLIHAWGLDMKLGYCVQGDRSRKIGVVDSEYVVHMGIPTLGGSVEDKQRPPDSSSNMTDRMAIRRRSHSELLLFQRRWKEAAVADHCWRDPYSGRR